MPLPRTRRAPPDAGLRGRLRDGLAPRGFDVTAVETGQTVQGLPDVHWMHQGALADGWIETKATDGWAVTMRPHQVGWHLRARRCHLRTAIAVWATGQGSGGPGRSALWLVPGGQAEVLAARGLRGVEPLGVWRGGPAAWPWDRLAELLLRGPTG